MSRRIRSLANPFGELFRSRPFARFWTGFTISALGDAMTRVALVWFVYQATKSPEAVGILLLCYTGPVLVGGLLAGYLLDRFDRGRVMLVDNLIRGLADGLIPLLYALGALALGEMVGATLAGSLTGSRGPGILICLAQLLSGLSLTLLLVGQDIGLPLVGALAGLTLLGVFSAPLTIWAQTLRMQIIPEPLRGRTFALLRTLMQGAGPLASAVAGFALPLIGAASLLGAAAALIGVPGLVGTQVRELRTAAKSAAIAMD